MNQEPIKGIDRSGNPFTIGICCVEDYPSLLEMYIHFSPKPASQGLPPEDPETCQNWLKNLFEIGVNLVAWRGNRVIGHAAFIPDQKGKSGEFVVFVDQDNRNLGIGTELTGLTLERTRQLGFESVWLTAPLSNFIAIKLYKKFGFTYSDMDPEERLMVVKLLHG